MAMLPKKLSAKYAKGQEDHVDAWLMSYADLITLLFTFFVIFVAVTYSKYAAIDTPAPQQQGAHRYDEQHFGMLSLDTPYASIYRSLEGIVAEGSAGQNIALEKTTGGLIIDMSAALFFQEGTANLYDSQVPLLKLIAGAIKEADSTSLIEVEGYTDDVAPRRSPFNNNWELSAMRAARVVSMLVDEGIRADSLHANSFANTRPLVPNSDEMGKPIEANRARNQRVVIRITKQQEKPKIAASF